MPTDLHSLNNLSLSDKPLFDAHVRQVPCILSSYAFAPIFVWAGLFGYYWTIIDETFCLFAECGGNCFMPLPPLGKLPSAEVISKCFDLMYQSSRSHSAARIENVPKESTDLFTALGYKVALKGVEYVYEREALVELRGRRFKNKREPYNYFVKHCSPVYRQYLATDLDACTRLFLRWREMRAARYRDEYYRALLEDSSSAHERGMRDANALGLTGRVVLVNGEVKGYTFGYPLTSDTFCVLFEITDLSVKGLSQYLFREFCRELTGCHFINTLDDSGLESLKRSKLSYHPRTLEPSYTILRPGAACTP